MIEVSPGLWIRGQLNEKRGQGEAIAYLQQLGIHSVMSVHPRGEPMLIGQSAIAYRHESLSDGKKISSRVQDIADWVWEHVLGGVLVTCHAGRNRSGLIVALTLMRLYTLSGEEALLMLRSQRPRAVANPAFEEYLKGLPKYDYRS
jgi:protein-tyrosine phosphatase